MTTQIIDGIKFRVNSGSYKIYMMMKQGKTIEAIATEIDLPLTSIKWYVSKFSKVITVTTLETTEANILTTSNNEKILDFEVIQDVDGLVLKVKTSEAFENYMKTTKQVIETNNLWNQSITAKCYKFKMVEDCLDDINLPIFHRGEINFAIFRVVGISNTQTFKITELLSENQLKLSIIKLIKTYKKFYRVATSSGDIRIKAEVLIQ